MPKPNLEEIFSSSPISDINTKPPLNEIFGNTIFKPIPEIMTSQTFTKETSKGELMTLRTFKKEEKNKYIRSGRMAKDIGQFLGGIIGFGVGATIGHPYVGGAFGGTIGRTIANLSVEQAKQFEIIAKKRIAKQPLSLKESAILYLAPPFSYPFVIEQMTPQKHLNLGREILTTAVAETISAPMGIVLTYAGRGILKGLLTARVAERGFERGFKKILDPEFYKNRVPKMIAEKTSRFFNRLSNVTGKEVDIVVNSPVYKKMTVRVDNLKSEIKNILPKGLIIEDLEASVGQKKLLQRATKLITSLGEIPEGKKITEKVMVKTMTEEIEISVSNLWKKRKLLDKIMNTYNWSEDSIDYLNKLRSILNKPIREAGVDIASAFNKYAFVKQGEYDLGKNFMVAKGIGGEIYASPAEKFAAELMSTKKDDLIRRLKDLDRLTNADDKIIDEFLDYAASEALDKKIGFGVFQEMLVGMLGGRKTIAQMGAFGQKPIIKAGEKILGRTVPIGLTNILTPEKE